MADTPLVTRWPPDPRFVIQLVVVVGCFVVILSPSAPEESNAAFGLLGVVVASIVANLRQY